MNLVFFKFNESLLALNHIDNLFSSAFSILVSILGHKRSYDSTYDSDSDYVARENQPLGDHFTFLLTMYWYCKEKIHVGHPCDLEG